MKSTQTKVPREVQGLPGRETKERNVENNTP